MRADRTRFRAFMRPQHELAKTIKRKLKSRPNPKDKGTECGLEVNKAWSNLPEGLGEAFVRR